MNTQVQFILTKNSKKSPPSQNKNSGGFMIEFVMSQENEHYRGGDLPFHSCFRKAPWTDINANQRHSAWQWISKQGPFY